VHELQALDPAFAGRLSVYSVDTDSTKGQCFMRLAEKVAGDTPLGEKQKKLKDLLQQIKDEQRALPLEEQEAFLSGIGAGLKEDRAKWFAERAKLVQSLKDSQRLNDATVDEAMGDYLDRGGSKTQEKVLASPDAKFKADGLRVTINKFNRMIQNAETAISYCAIEGRKVHKAVLEAQADTATGATLEAFDLFVEKFLKTEAHFLDFTARVEEAHGLDPSWGQRAERLGRGPFFGQMGGLRLLQPEVLAVARIDDFVEACRRILGDDNPFAMPDGSVRVFQDATIPWSRKNFLEGFRNNHPQGQPEVPALEKTYDDIAFALVND
jgi:hypothetical protein